MSCRPYPPFSLSPLVGLVAALFATVALAEPGGEEQTLATVTVADRAAGDLPTEKTGAYTVKKSESATRLGLSLKETPQQVSVLTRSQLDDFHLNDLGEALGATSGIVVERPETDRVYYTARGFDVTNFQYDGIGIANVYDMAGAETDTAIFDRIDTVYGANGLLSTTGYPSATVNFIRKRPTLDFAATATATVGSWNKSRLEGDVSGALIDSGRLRGRLVGVQEDKDSYLDRYSRSKTVFYGVLEADLDDRTTLALGHHEQENKPRGVMWGALPMYNTDGSQTHYDVSTSTATNWAFWNLKTKSSFLELSRQFNEDWSGKAVVTHNEYTGNSRLFYVYGTPDRNTGLGLKAYPSEYDLERTQTQADVYATGRFELGGRKHDLSLGMTWSRASLKDVSYYGRGIGDPVPALDGWNGSYPVPPFDASVDGSNFNDHRRSFYLSTRLHLNDRTKLILGANHTTVKVDGVSYSQSHNQDSSKTAPYVGLVYDLTANLAAYGSYTKIFDPQYQLDQSGAPLDPVRGSSREVGLKGEFFNKRLNGSVSLFRSEQLGLAEQAGYIGTRAYYRGIDAESKGIQMDVGGAVTERLQVNLGLTHLTLKDPDGNAVRTYTPRNLLRLAGTYRVPFVAGLKVGANLTWQSDIYRVETLDSGATTQVRQKAYGLVNLMAQYDIDKNLSLSATLNNLTNEKYLTSLYWSQSYYGAPRNASLSLTWKY